MLKKLPVATRNQLEGCKIDHTVEKLAADPEKGYVDESYLPPPPPPPRGAGGGEGGGEREGGEQTKKPPTTTPPE